MGTTWADRLLRPRWLGLVAAVVVAVALAGPLAAAFRPPTVSFARELGTLFTSDGELTVDWDPGAGDLREIVVRRWLGDGTAVELGRGRLYGADASDTSHFANPDLAMVCPRAEGGPRRFLFGVVATTLSPAHGTADDLVAYFGPPATGARFAGGLYLVALEPGRVDPGAALELRRTNAAYAMTGAIFDRVVAHGAAQASGCIVA